MILQPTRAGLGGWMIVVAVCTTTPLLAADLGDRQGVQSAPYLEWTVDNAAWSGNPFDIVATVEFTHDASGETRRTQMFFVGGRSWAFRFTGTRQGSWTFTTVRDDADLDGHTGRVEIAANARAHAHGFLTNINGKWGWEEAESVFVPRLVMRDYIAGEGSSQAFVRESNQIDEFMVGHGSWVMALMVPCRLRRRTLVRHPSGERRGRIFDGRSRPAGIGVRL